MVFTWLLLGSLLCIFLPHGLTKRFNLAFLSLYKFTPVLGKGIPLSPVPTLASTVSPVSGEYQKLQNEYQQLQNHCANLWAELAGEHNKVQKLSAIRTRFPALAGAAIITADIISVSSSAPGSKATQLVINRGSADGLKKDQFVIAENSVVGRISDLSTRTAVVDLINHKNSNIFVEVAGTKVARKLTGNSNNARIGLLPKKYPVKPGAIVYTCRIPGLLDVPFIVGRIAECKIDDASPLLWDIVVEPAVDIETLTSVSIIIMNP